MIPTAVQVQRFHGNLYTSRHKYYF